MLKSEATVFAAVVAVFSMVCTIPVLLDIGVATTAGELTETFGSLLTVSSSAVLVVVFDGVLEVVLAFDDNELDDVFVVGLGTDTVNFGGLLTVSSSAVVVFATVPELWVA